MYIKKKRGRPSSNNIINNINIEYLEHNIKPLTNKIINKLKSDNMTSKSIVTTKYKNIIINFDD